MVIPLGAFLALCLLSFPSEARDQNVTVKIGLLQPYTGPIPPFVAADFTTAFQWGLEDLALEGLLAEAGVEIFHAAPRCDTRADRATAVECAIELVEAGCIAVFGGIFSPATIAAQLIFQKYHIPQCSGGSTSVFLSNEVEFPYFFRTVPSDHLRSQAVVALLEEYDLLDNFGTISTDDEFSLNIVKDISNLALIKQGTQQFGMVNRKGEIDGGAMLDTIQSSTVQAVLIFGFAVDSLPILNEARKRGVFDQYVWIGGESWATYPLMTPEELLAGGWEGTLLELEDIIVVTGSAGFGEKYATVAERFAANGGTGTSVGGLFAYDCAYAFAHGLRTLGHDRVPHLNMGNDTETTMATREQFMSAIVNSSFDGASGFVDFDDAGDRLGYMDIRQMHLRDFDDSGRWSPLEGFIDNKLTWGGSSVPPQPPVSAVPDTVNVVPEVRTALWTIAGILVAFVFVVVGWIFKYRRTRTVYGASTVFMLCSLLGGLLILVACFIHLLPKTMAICLAVPWLVNLGFTLGVDAVVLKMFRLHKIFHYTHSPRVVLTDVRLLMILAGLLFIDVVLLSVYSYVVMMKIPDAALPECVTGGTWAEWLFFVLLVLYKCMELFAASWYIHKNKTVSTTFSDSQTLAQPIYSVLLSSAGWLVASSFVMSFRQKVVVDVCCALAGVGLCSVGMFAPKMYFLYKSKDRPMLTDELSTSGSRVSIEDNKDRKSNACFLADLEGQFDEKNRKLSAMEKERNTRNFGLSALEVKMAALERNLRELFMEINWHRKSLKLTPYRYEKRVTEAQSSGGGSKSGSGGNGSPRGKSHTLGRGPSQVALTSVRSTRSVTSETNPMVVVLDDEDSVKSGTATTPTATTTTTTIEEDK